MNQRLAGLTAAQRGVLVHRPMKRRKAAPRHNVISLRAGDGPAPLSYVPELLWMRSKLFEDGISYNAPRSFQLKGSLDLEPLERALEARAERHSILRGTYRLIQVEWAAAAPAVTKPLAFVQATPS
jgi:hypothetical protein